jgi:hypothetical protein
MARAGCLKDHHTLASSSRSSRASATNRASSRRCVFAWFPKGQPRRWPAAERQQRVMNSRCSRRSGRETAGRATPTDARATPGAISGGRRPSVDPQVATAQASIGRRRGNGGRQWSARQSVTAAGSCEEPLGVQSRTTRCSLKPTVRPTLAPMDDARVGASRRTWRTPPRGEGGVHDALRATVTGLGGPELSQNAHWAETDICRVGGARPSRSEAPPRPGRAVQRMSRPRASAAGVKAARLDAGEHARRMGRVERRRRSRSGPPLVAAH